MWRSEGSPCVPLCPSCAFFLSGTTSCSYQRLKPNCWAGAYQCWGFENREAAIRVASPPTPGAPPILDPTGSSKGTSGPEPGSAEAKAAQGPRLGPTNFEVKGCDGAAQPHLVIAAVIAAGMDGIAKKTPLPSPVGAQFVVLAACAT